MAGAANLTNKGKGRPKGALNKSTTVAKEALAHAFDELGGMDALVAWARSDGDNLKAFYQTIWPKLLPLQVAGDADNPLRVHTEIRLVGMSDVGGR